ncbi:MAG: PilW family protein [Hyphomonas sp.]|nr:PilW family protein [Hyphomonas sp.]
MLAQKQKGLTLIELMISLLIGLVVTGVVIQVFVSNRVTFELQEGMAKVQESGRLSLQYLTRELREAGSGLDFNIGSLPTACMIDKDVCDGILVSPIFGEIAAANSTFAVPGSDIVTIGRGDGCDAQVDGPYKPNTANFKATKHCASIAKDNILMLVDFKQAVIFSVNNSPSASNLTVNHAGPQNVVSNKLGGIMFDDGARVMGFSNYSYFVRDTGQVDSTGAPIRALAMRNNFAANPASTIVDIVDGVENMRVYYGVPNAAGDALVYKRANAVTAADEWELVRSVEMELLLVSDVASPGAATQAVVFDGGNVRADGRFRQTYSTVAAIRNRLN